MLPFSNFTKKVIVKKIHSFLQWEHPEHIILFKVQSNGKLNKTFSYKNEQFHSFSVADLYSSVDTEDVKLISRINETGISLMTQAKTSPEEITIRCCFNKKDAHGKVSTIEQKLKVIHFSYEPNSIIFCISLQDVTEINPTRKVTASVFGSHKSFTEQFLKLKDKIRSIVSLNSPVLTPQEKIILQKIANGETSKDISINLSIAKSTVDKHRQNMIRKFNVKNVTALVQIARNGHQQVI